MIKLRDRELDRQNLYIKTLHRMRTSDLLFGLQWFMVCEKDRK